MKKESKARMSYGSSEHWEKDLAQVESSDPKYSNGQFSNPKQLLEGADALAKFAKKKRMKY